MTDPVLPNQKPHEDRSMEEYAATREKLHEMSDEDLRRVAENAGVDGAPTMERDHLLAKLMAEPGENDL